MKQTLKYNALQRWEKKFQLDLEQANHNAAPNQEQRDWLKRSITPINEDVIEVKNHFTGKRWLFLFYFCVFNYFIFVQPYIERGSIMPKSVWGVVYPQGYGEFFVKRSEMKYYNGLRTEEPDRSEWVNANAQGAKDARLAGVFILIIAFGPLLLWLFGPFRGVRVDRKRQLIYAYRGGQLYCHKVRAPNLNDLDMSVFKTSLMVLKETSPLLYVLPSSKKPHKGKRFMLGHNPVMCFNQALLLNDAIANYLYQTSDPLWLEELKQNQPYEKNHKDRLGKLNSWCLLKTGWPKNIEQKLDAHLAALDKE